MSALAFSALLVLAPSQWEAPADACPTASEVEQRIEEFSGELVAPGYRARVEIVEGGFRLTLDVSREDVEVQRTLFDADCPTLAEAAALTVASLALPLNHTTTPVVHEDEEPREPTIPRGTRYETSRERPSPLPAAVAPSTTHRQALALRLRAAGGADTGTAGPIASAARVGFDLRGRWLSGAIVGTILGPRPIRDGAAAASAAGVLLGVRGCVRLLQRAVAIPLCVGGTAGAVVADPRTLEQPVRRRMPIVSLEAVVQLEWSFHSRLGLFVAMEGSAYVVRPRVEYTQATGDPALLHQVPRLGVRPLIGLTATLWSRR